MILRKQLCSPLKWFPFCSISSSSRLGKEKSQEALDYCVRIVKERDLENYLAALMMHKRIQPRIFSTLALNAELSTLRHKIKRNSGVDGIYQLTFWRDALETLGRQDQNALLPRQPVITALKAYADVADLPLFLNLIAARQQTLGDRPFQNVAKLEENSKMLYGSLILLQMHSLYTFITLERNSNEKEDNTMENGNANAFPSNKLQDIVDSMASAIGILTLLRATVLLLHEGIVLLPEDITTLHGINAEAAYRGPDSLKAVAKDLCEISSAHLANARSQTEHVMPELRPALLSAGLRCDHLLSILNGNNFNLLDVRLQKPHPFSTWKLWWRNRRKIF